MQQQQHIDTREAAKASIAHALTGMRGEIFVEITCATQGGLTYEEVADRLSMRLSTVVARLNELCEAGHIKDSGHRRPTSTKRMARVYVATAFAKP